MLERGTENERTENIMFEFINQTAVTPSYFDDQFDIDRETWKNIVNKDDFINNYFSNVDIQEHGNYFFSEFNYDSFYWGNAIKREDFMSRYFINEEEGQEQGCVVRSIGQPGVPGGTAGTIQDRAQVRRGEGLSRAPSMPLHWPDAVPDPSLPDGLRTKPQTHGESGDRYQLQR